jgi:hypothetical protein
MFIKLLLPNFRISGVSEVRILTPAYKMPMSLPNLSSRGLIWEIFIMFEACQQKMIPK